MLTAFQQKMIAACDTKAKGTCPSSWVCAKRGCYQDALNNYADFKGKREAWEVKEDHWYPQTDAAGNRTWKEKL